MGLGRSRGAGGDYRIRDPSDWHSNFAGSGAAPPDATSRASKSRAASAVGAESRGGLGDVVSGFKGADAGGEERAVARGTRLPAPAHGRGDYRRPDAGDPGFTNSAALVGSQERYAGQRGDFPAGSSGPGYHDCAGASARE